MNEFSIKIKPHDSWLSLNLAEIWEYRELLFFLAWRDVKVRYKQTALGVVWALLQPLATTLIFTVLFSNIAKFDSKEVPYPLLALSGFAVWTFVSNAITFAGNSLVNYTGLITKIYFPRLVMPLASVGASFLDLLLSLAVLIIVMLFFGVILSWKILLAPLFLILLLILVFGIGILFSALNVKYRDVKFILPFGLQLWLFISPVFYPLEILPENIRFLWKLNPLTGILEGFRAALFNLPFDFVSLGISVGFSLTLFAVALFVFRQMEDDFADLI